MTVRPDVDVASLLEPARVAAATAPILDRLRIGIGRAIVDRAGDLADRHHVAMPDRAVFSMLRTTVPDRIVTIADLGALFVYAPTDGFHRSLQVLLDAGLCERLDQDAVRLTDTGRNLTIELRERTSDIVDRVWDAHGSSVESLAPLAERLVGAAAMTAGPGFRVVSPVYEPAETSAAMLFAERLTPLRMHRFDAHVAAWRSAGLTVGQIVTLNEGAERDAIEPGHQSAGGSAVRPPRRG